MKKLPLVIYRHAKDSKVAKTVELEWSSLPGQLRKLALTSGLPSEKRMGLCWSPVRLKPGKDTRANGNVATLSALVLDYDFDPDKKAFGATLEQAKEVWADWTAWVHTTWSHDPGTTGPGGIGGPTPARPRCRIILPFSREVTPREYKQIWAWANDRGTNAGLVADEQTKDLSRMWFFPYDRPGYQSDEWEGGGTLPLTDILAGAFEEERLGAPTGLIDGWPVNTLFRSEAGPVAISDWAKGADPGMKLKGYCPSDNKSSFGSAFLRRTAAGVLFCCTSHSHAHDGELKLWWQDPDVEGRQVAGDRKVLSQLQWNLNKDGDRKGLKTTLDNLRTILSFDTRWQGRFWLDTFRNQRMLDDEPLQDNDYLNMLCWLERAYEAAWNKGAVIDAVNQACDDDERNPLTDELGSYSWDGIARLEEFFIKSAGCEDTPLIRAYGKKFLVGAIARAYDPGCKVDTMPVLSGPQGFLKSSIFRALASGEWFSDSAIDLRSKDAYSMLDGVWIYEIAEMEAMNKADVSRVKQFLSSQVDQYRPPYGRAKITRSRQTVFIGTTNEQGVLRDTTGSRRFWAVHTGPKADLQWVKDNRVQLWAEARMAYEAGAIWWLTNEEDRMRAKGNEEFQSQDPWAEPVRAALSVCTIITASSLLTDTLEIEVARQTTRDLQRVGSILAVMPMWKRDRLWLKGGIHTYYHSEGLEREDAREMMKSQLTGAIH
jgi:predicted P-loop ATPase